MPRPQRCRRICGEPKCACFRPENASPHDAVVLSLDEYETLRLVDLEKLTHEETARRMDISRTTVTEIYEAARYKVADSIVNGKPLRIAGGNYRICDGSAGCFDGGCRRGTTLCENQKTERGMHTIPTCTAITTTMRMTVRTNAARTAAAATAAAVTTDRTFLLFVKTIIAYFYAWGKQTVVWNLPAPAETEEAYERGCGAAAGLSAVCGHRAGRACGAARLSGSAGADI